MFDKTKKAKRDDLKDQVEKLVEEAKARGEAENQGFTALEVDFGPDEHENGYNLARQIEKVATEIHTDFNSSEPGVCADCFWSALSALAAIQSKKATRDVSMPVTLMHIVKGVAMLTSSETVMNKFVDMLDEEVKGQRGRPH